MALTELPKLIDTLPGIQEIAKSLAGSGGVAAIDGLAGPAKAFALAGLAAKVDRPLLVVTYSQEAAQRLWDDLVRFGVPAERACVLPASQGFFLEGDVTDFRVVGERIAALMTLSRSGPTIVIGTAEAVLQRTAPQDELLPHVFTLRADETIDFNDVVGRLVRMGYEPANTVTRPGEFSRRGGILDVFPSTSDDPVRIELFGDEIESIRPFDVATQRSTGRHPSVELAPAREVRLAPERVRAAVDTIKERFKSRIAELAAEKNREAIERLTDKVEADLARLQQSAYFDGLEQYLPYLVGETVCALDYLRPEAAVVLDEPNQVSDHWTRTAAEVHEARERQWNRGASLDSEMVACPYALLVRAIAARSALVLSLLGRGVEGLKIERRISVNSAALDSYRGRLASLADEIGTWLANECSVLLVTDQPARVREILAEMNLPVRLARSGSAVG